MGGGNLTAVFCDTGWEHPDTYKHVNDVCLQMGVRLITLKSKYDFVSLAAHKKRFPSTNARFCTSELKMKPMIDYVLSLKESCIIIQGIRAGESTARAAMEEECMYYNPLALFVDKRSETLTAKDRGKTRIIEIKPDVIADFTNLPFEDNSFYMVVFDPPHLKTLGATSWMAKKYGKLPKDWQSLIHDGFTECMRVLKPYGTLVFKWNESEIKTVDVLSVIPFKPLFGHTTGRQSKTIWMCFMKLPINS